MTDTARTETLIGFTKPDRSALRGKNLSGEVMFGQEWHTMPDAPGIRWREVTFSNSEISKPGDAADIEMEPGSWTPPEFVATNATYCEVPQWGEITIVACDLSHPDTVYIDKFDPEKEGYVHAVEMKKNWLFAVYAHKSNKKPVHHLEYEEPAWAGEDTLPHVPRGASLINGISIPSRLWEIMGKVEREEETDQGTSPDER